VFPIFAVVITFHEQMSSMWLIEAQLWNKTNGINRTRLLQLEEEAGPLYGTYEEQYATEEIYVNIVKTDPAKNDDIKRFSERAKDVAILVSSSMLLGRISIPRHHFSSTSFALFCVLVNLCVADNPNPSILRVVFVDTVACIGTRMIELGSVLPNDVRKTILRIFFELSVGSFGFLLMGQTFFDGEDDLGLIGLETTFVDSHEFVRLAFMVKQDQFTHCITRSTFTIFFF
jgi:hypothetical protein